MSGARHRILRPVGVALLIVLGFVALVRLACVSHREICEDAGGDHFEIADVIHVCSMPPGSECPPTYERQSDTDDCRKSALLGSWFRWETW